MKLTFNYIHMASSEAIETLVSKKMDKLQELVTYPLEFRVRVGLDGTEQWVELTCNAEHRTLVSEGRTVDVYEAVDLACTKMETQLKKEREKRKGHEASHKDLSRLGEDVGLCAPHVGKKSE